MAGSVELASAEAENRLLSCLINVRMGPASALALGLARDDYAWEVNALIHDAITRIVERGHSVETTVLCEELASSDHLDAIGGEAVINQLAASPHDPNLLPQYVEIVRDRSMRRRVMKGFESGTQILLSEPDGKKAVELVQDNMFRAFDRYLQSAYSGLSPEDLRNAWLLSKGVSDYVPYPYDSMNHLSIGRALGTLSIWGGYPSDGKSTMALRSVVTVCASGRKAALVSLEMTQEQLTVRLLAFITGISADKIQRNDIDLEQQALIEAAFDTIESWQLTIYCDPSMTVQDLRAIQMRERYDYIAIDYLQRFDFVSYDQVPRMARQLKNLALSTLCAIDLLSQVNPKEIRPGSNPFTKPDNLSLYGGKATGHEADNIFFIWGQRQQDEHGGWQRNGHGLLICTKGRQGTPEYEIPMVFDPTRVTWEEA